MPVPPEDVASGVANVRAPSAAKLDVAVAPKYAGPYVEKRVVDAAALKTWSAVQVLAFAVLSERVLELKERDAPIVALCATPEAFVESSTDGTPEIVKFVVLAVPKYPVPDTLKLVDEALLSVVFPVTLRVPATATLPAASIVVVAVAPKYAGPNEEKSVVEAEVTSKRLVEVLNRKFDDAPSVPPLLNCTCVSAPATVAEPRHVSLTRTQPPFMTSPFAKVEDAKVLVMSSTAALMPPPKVEVAEPVTTRLVVVALPKLPLVPETDVPEIDDPEIETPEMEPPLMVEFVMSMLSSLSILLVWAMT